MDNNQKPETQIQDDDIVFDETLQSYYDILYLPEYIVEMCNLNIRQKILICIV